MMTKDELELLEAAVFEVYNEKSLTKKMEHQQIKYIELPPQENEDGSWSTRWAWEDGNEDIIVPVMHSEFEFITSDDLSVITEKAIDCLIKVLKTETSLLEKATSVDKLYTTLPLQIRLWEGRSGEVHGTIRVALNTSATPTLEEASEATQS